MVKNPSFCPVPWVSISTKPNGDLRLCCHANVSKSKGMHKSENNENYNLNTSKIEDAQNSYLAKSVRKSMLEGKQHEMCTRCNREDSQGVRSRRQYENLKWESVLNLEAAKNNTSPDGSLMAESKLSHLDVRFGNLCNLTCRMCGPTDSSSWYKEYLATENTEFQDSSGQVQLRSEPETGRVFAINDPYKWHENNAIWLDFAKHIPHVTDYYFAGGEPLLIQRHYQLLEKIVDSGHAHKVRIEYNTNLTQLPDRVLDLWKNFRQVNVGVSIDGYKNLNEYIRYPSQWAQLVSNIHKLDNAENNIQCWAACTLQIYNCVGILDLIDWIYQSDFKKFGRQNRLPFITTHPLHNPIGFSLKALPTDAKIYLRKKYNDYFSKMKIIDPRFSTVENNLSGYLNYMDSADESAQLVEFIRKTQAMDKYRNQNFSLTCPEIANFIGYTK
jgi:MoaA/NifB/PqqE/SkfB family radical SAM enzyme